MGLTACTEYQCLFKGALLFFFTDLILLDFVTLKIFVEEHKSRSFRLRVFLQSPITSYLITKNKPHMTAVAYPGILFREGWGGSANSVKDRGQRQRGSGGGSPPSQGFWRQL